MIIPGQFGEANWPSTLLSVRSQDDFPDRQIRRAHLAAQREAADAEDFAGASLISAGFHHGANQDQTIELFQGAAIQICLTRGEPGFQGFSKLLPTLGRRLQFIVGCL